MRPFRFYILFVSFLIATMLVSSAWIFPFNLIFGRPKKKTYYDYRPKMTVEKLEKKYGVPAYHRNYDPPVTETSMKSVKITFDEKIAFEKDKHFIVYYFSKGKLLATVLENKDTTTDMSESPESPESEPSTESLESTSPDSDDTESEPTLSPEEEAPY